MSVVLRALKYFSGDRSLIAAWLAVIALSTLLGLLQAWPTAVLVDSVLTDKPQTGFFHRLFLAPLPDGMLAQVIGVTLIGMLMKICQDGMQWLIRVLKRRINLNGLQRTRCDLYSKLQELGPAYQKTQLQGDSIYRVSIDADGCSLILNVLVEVFFSVLTLTVMALIMFSRSVTLTWFALSIVPMLVFANLYFGPRVKQRTFSAKEADTSVTNTLIRAISCISVVQMFGRQATEYAAFERTTMGSADRWQTVNRTEAWYQYTVQLIFAFGGAIIFGYGGYLVYNDQFVNRIEGGFTVGDIMVFMVYLGGLWDHLCKITGLGVNIKPGMAGAERVFQVLDLKPQAEQSPHAKALAPAMRTITLERVFFAYPGKAAVLRDVSVRIEPGQFVAFVGPSGSGKSTILSLLPRFYDPESGSIRLDGQDVRQLKLADLRAHFSFASQESTLLPSTIAENIAYGNPLATPSQIKAAAHAAGAHFIDELPDGYETLVAEGGGNLSGGQKQRIAVARALLSPAPILVLDEPTSALDPEHERLILDSLKAHRGSKTIILVTHRLAAVSQCDQIFVVAGGTLEEQGTHIQLLEAGGRYARMLADGESQLTQEDEAC